LVNAIKDVRSNDHGATWAVASWQINGKNVVLNFGGSGKGSVNEFRQALCASKDTTSYGILRVQQTIDKSVTVKFIFITFQGPDLPPMAKAKISTLRGGVLQVFHPFHVEMFVDSMDEVNEDALSQRLGGMDREPSRD